MIQRLGSKVVHSQIALAILSSRNWHLLKPWQRKELNPIRKMRMGVVWVERSEQCDRMTVTRNLKINGRYWYVFRFSVNSSTGLDWTYFLKEWIKMNEIIVVENYRVINEIGSSIKYYKDFIMEIIGDWI